MSRHSSRPEPVRADGLADRAVWSVQHEDLVAISVWTERRLNLGEDAEPTFLYRPDARYGIIAVYDGAGGIGSAMVERAADGRKLTGAYIGARLAKLGLERWFVDPRRQPDRGSADVEELQASLRSALRTVPAVSSKLGGTLRKWWLPTTVAAIAFEHPARGGLTVSPLWAGDSRAYLLSAKSGLQQLSRDDSAQQDAFGALRNDEPMTNVVSAGQPFRIWRRDLPAELPAVMVCATDGFFNYVQTPAHFEMVLLTTLSNAARPHDWGLALAGEVTEYTGDDASLVVAAVGYKSFSDLKRSFERRRKKITEEHHHPFAKAGEDLAARESARIESWRQYRVEYEARLSEIGLRHAPG